MDENKIRVSRLAELSFVSSMLACSFLIGCFGMFGIEYISSTSFGWGTVVTSFVNLIAAIATALLTLVIGIISIIRLRLSGSQLKGMPYALLSITIVLGPVLLIILIHLSGLWAR